MQQQNVIDTYNKVAGNYAEKLFNELDNKPLDRLLLKAFAEENKTKGRIIDFGCGPGQTTNFLVKSGVTDLLGTDLSPEMVAKARELNPAIEFETADMLKLHYAANTFGAAVAFYAIVHFTHEQLKTAFTEIHRVLKPGGQFLFSFHMGNETVHRDEFFDVEVDIDFYYFETEPVVKYLKEAGFKPVNVVERYPYADVEFPSKRAYVWVEK